MAQFPALSLWTDAWIADTKHLTRCERGTYLDLLILMWRTAGCRVPNDDAWLGRHLGMTPTEVVLELRPLILEFCQSDGNFIQQKRLSIEFVRAKRFHTSQTARAKSRWRNNKKSTPAVPTYGNATLPSSHSKNIEADASISSSNPTATDCKIEPEPKKRFAYPPEFETFWQQYPRGEGKGGAHKVWVQIVKTGKATNEELIAGAMRYATDPNRDPSYTKHASTWLNAGCWGDAPLPKRGGQGNGRQRDDSRSIRKVFDDYFGTNGPGDVPREADLKLIPGGRDK